MATSDIRIGSFHRPTGRSMVPATFIEASNKTANAGQVPFLLAVLKRRWYLLLFILPLMGAAGYGAAEYFGSTTAKVSTSLLQTGLPMPSGQQIYKPLEITSSEVLIKSPKNLSKIINLQGLTIPPAMFGKFLEVKANRSGVLEMTLTWADTADAVKILTTINENFINEVAEQRQETIKSYIPDVQDNFLKAKGKVKDLTDSIQAVKGLIEIKVENHAAGYVTGIALVENAFDQAEVQKQSLESQLDALTEARKKLLKKAKSQLLDQGNQAFQTTLTHYAANHPDRPKIAESAKQLSELSQHLEDERSFSEWFDNVIQISKRWLPEQDLQAFSKLLQYDEALTGLDNQRNSLELALLPKHNEIDRLQKRLTDQKNKFDKLKESAQAEAKTANNAAQQIDQLEAELEEAESSRKELQSQLNNLRQLKNTQVREFTVITPPSFETVEISSNKKKLFVGGFFLVGLLLIPPVLLVEWLARRETPIEEASRVFSLPVLGKDIELKLAEDDIQRPHEQDSLRLLALRIQQSLGGADSSMVVFSSLDRSEPAALLVAEIGKCLAEREERVLIVDASGSNTTDDQLRHSLNEKPRMVLLTSELPLKSNQTALTTNDSQHGLAEYLLKDSLSLNDLIQTTADPQIDYLHGGIQPLPKEGFSTRKLTNLFLDCRKQYSTILVIGPTAYQNADLQMLAARVDGIIFTVGKAGRNNKAGYEALQELLDLDAPILGVVG